MKAWYDHTQKLTHFSEDEAEETACGLFIPSSFLRRVEGKQALLYSFCETCNPIAAVQEFMKENSPPLFLTPHLPGTMDPKLFPDARIDRLEMNMARLLRVASLMETQTALLEKLLSVLYQIIELRSKPP